LSAPQKAAPPTLAPLQVANLPKRKFWILTFYGVIIIQVP